MSDQYTSAFHAEMRRHHRLLAEALTATDAYTSNRRTAHEHAAEAHDRAASGWGSSTAAITASQRAGIDPFAYDDHLASYCKIGRDIS